MWDKETKRIKLILKSIIKRLGQDHESNIGKDDLYVVYSYQEKVELEQSLKRRLKEFHIRLRKECLTEFNKRSKSWKGKGKWDE